MQAGPKPPNSTLEYALYYASLGIYVNGIQPNTKALIETGPVLARASRDPEVLTQLLLHRPDYNIGVVTGQDSNLLILDIDVKGTARGIEGLRAMERICGPLPKTLVETTPSKGLHYFYKLDGVDIPNGKLRIEGIDGVEVFGRPHNVVVAPSVIDGLSYETIERREIVPIPKVFTDFILANYAKRDKAGGKKLQGGRNEGLFAESCRMRRLNIPEPDAWIQLQAMNIRLCTPPLSEMELKKLFRSAWKYDPAYALTELGNAQLFADRHGQNLKFVHESKRWLHWDDHRWCDDITGRVLHMMKVEMRKMSHAVLDIEDDNHRKAAGAWAKKSEMRNTMINSLFLVPSEPGTTVQQNDLDADPWLFACNNAILDLRTGGRIGSKREDLITRCANVNFDPQARAPRFHAFLERILPSKAVREFLKRYFGYALTGDTREQCMVICWGTGANGKGTLMNTILHLVGDYGAMAAASTWLEKRETIPNDVAALAGKRLVLSSEFAEGSRIQTNLLKSATGEDPLSARFMRGEWFSFVPQFKIAFATNHKPNFDGGDQAMVRRLRLVEFGVKIPLEQRDGNLKDALKAELSGILNWLIEGCLEWQKEGLSFPDEVRRATAEYARDSDAMGQFLIDRCEVGETFSTTSKPLYMAYLSWCQENGCKPSSQGRFKQALTDRGFKSKHTKKGTSFQGLKVLKMGNITESLYEY